MLFIFTYKHIPMGFAHVSLCSEYVNVFCKYFDSLKEIFFKLVICTVHILNVIIFKKFNSLALINLSPFLYYSTIPA